MKTQWTLLIGLVFAIIIAIFAVVNVDQVPVNYIFGEAHWPLILVILGSAFIGAVSSISFIAFNLFRMNRQIKHLAKDLQQRDEKIGQLEQELTTKNEQLVVQQTKLLNNTQESLQEEK
ncbi:lipopolysaccharide assembly protein LapA domain-containing protein [Metasolibacillus sp. FSL H7-0170]|uniref:LapA family protein n=1 Tax=Metasolibacillus TaxID=2703677 RepID=UPI000791FFF5|nr:lipopolysaccharide assembly protein LapA domain-containing protein [Metasolibacillus fluoroglycofenilyticus]KYG91677.1 hypothetical protein A0U40_01665 [[Bacillus] sp. KCTC 13219]